MPGCRKRWAIPGDPFAKPSQTPSTGPAANEPADADSLLGRIHLSQRRHDSAKRRLDNARQAHEEAGNLPEAAFDLAGLLEIALGQEDTRAVRKHTTDLKNLLPELPSSDLSDTLSYRLYLRYYSIHRDNVSV